MFIVFLCLVQTFHIFRWIRCLVLCTAVFGRIVPPIRQINNINNKLFEISCLDYLVNDGVRHYVNYCQAHWHTTLARIINNQSSAVISIVDVFCISRRPLWRRRFCVDQTSSLTPLTLLIYLTIALRMQPPLPPPTPQQRLCPRPVTQWRK